MPNSGPTELAQKKNEKKNLGPRWEGGRPYLVQAHQID